MASSFMAMVYAVLKENNIDTSKLTPEECVKKFNELSSKDNLKKEEVNKYNLGKINTNLYNKITGKKLVSNKIVFPESNRIHTLNRHGNLFEKYKDKFSNIINSPDYVFQGKTKDRLLIVKKFSTNVEVVLELSFENPKFSNKIISMWELNEKDLQKLKTKTKTLYKK